ncbi:hypothetical protein IE81DRAFT_140345 [Ceraceosorus guamensis]|uniref:Uncharacterized protein n=1 Tax=Ceraceosorus guamensis TaxID=1522189 RepID=A0A316VXM9_9BASI|nr:hypothetical protein IE81DRAFT_140345 [Ceraceosorus guamensis]PWN42212.1 hypothetical protein IE81DRAFT_140345 [Ceraceosorus guamensis]
MYARAAQFVTPLGDLFGWTPLGCLCMHGLQPNGVDQEAETAASRGWRGVACTALLRAARLETLASDCEFLHDPHASRLDLNNFDRRAAHTQPGLRRALLPNIAANGSTVQHAHTYAPGIVTMHTRNVPQCGQTARGCASARRDVSSNRPTHLTVCRSLHDHSNPNFYTPHLGFDHQHH